MNRNIFLIVEGPDNVGKTTLINNIKNHYNDYTLHTIHYSNVKQSSTEDTIRYTEKLHSEMFRMMLNAVPNDKSGLIFDRSHLGEMVYGPIYRGYTGEYVIDIERKFKHILSIWDNLLLITLVDTPERLIERDDGLSFSTDINKKIKEIKNFKNAHDKSMIKHKLLIDIKDHDAEAVKNVVINKIETLRK